MPQTARFRFLRVDLVAELRKLHKRQFVLARGSRREDQIAQLDKRHRLLAFSRRKLVLKKRDAESISGIGSIRLSLTIRRVEAGRQAHDRTASSDFPALRIPFPRHEIALAPKSSSAH